MRPLGIWPVRPLELSGGPRGGGKQGSTAVPRAPWQLFVHAAGFAAPNQTVLFGVHGAQRPKTAAANSAKERHLSVISPFPARWERVSQGG